MYYSKFTIKNFKGIKNLSIDLDKQPKSKVFTLVGLNESGKTSILEAINFFQVHVPVKERHKLIPKNEKIDFNDDVSVAAIVKLKDTDNEKLNKFAVSLGYKYLNPLEDITIEKSYTYINSNYETNANNWYIKLIGLKKKAAKEKQILHSLEAESDWQRIVAFIKSELLPTILYYPNFLFDFPEKIYLDEHEDDTLEQNTYRGVIQDILYSINDKLNIQTHLLKRLINKSNSDKEALDQTLARMSSIVSSTVFQAWAKLFDIVGKEIVIKAGSELVLTKNRYYLEFKLKEGSSQFDITERSLGFKWFFSFLLFTEFRKNRVTENGEILFLLDEPASNLHSTAQKNLLKTFEEIISKASLMYTTHSHHLINPDWLSGVYIVRNKGLDYTEDFYFDSNKTDIEAMAYKKFVANYPDQRDYFQPILDTIDHQPGLLEKVPSIIVTEGKNDYYSFKYINEVYLDKKFKLHFYPGGGANANCSVIRLYLAWGRKFNVILDGDKGGKSAKLFYIKEVGDQILKHIHSFNEIDSTFDGSATEDLFTNEEKLIITQHFDNKITSYDKGKFNTSIQSLFLEKKKIELSARTIKNFEAIFKYLNKYS